MTSNICIPNTDLSLCPIGLGTAGAGLSWDGSEADTLFDAYLDMGGNVIDTARVYSDWVPPEIGRSERVIGDWLQQRWKRDRIVLITKGGHPTFNSPTADLRIPRMTRADLTIDIDLSLKALRVDTIDIYFYHRDDRAQSVEELIEALEHFRRKGKLRYYGCSNWNVDRIQAADAYCNEKQYRGFIADQALFNVGVKYMSHMPDDSLVCVNDGLFDYHKRNLRNLAMPYMGVASGFFHAYAAKGVDGVRNSPYYTARNIAVAEHCKLLMLKYNASISQILLGFFRIQPFPCVPLYGPKTLEQLQDAMGALTITFEPDDFEL